MQAKRVAENGRKFGKAGAADAGVLGGHCSGCGLSAGVRCCAHLRWPTPVRPSPDSRVKGKDFQMFWKKHRGQCRKGKPKSVLSTLWGTRATSGARPTGISRRDSLPPLNAMPVVQAMQPVKRVLCKRAVAALGKRKMSPAPTTASSRNSLPALSAAAVVQVLCPHSVSCANGQLRHSGEGKGRPRRRQQAAGIHFRR